MTRRRIEREVDELTDDVLGNLKADERLRHYLQQLKADQPGQAERLTETAPREDHSMNDPEYVKKQLAATIMRERAIYRLRILYLTYAHRQTFDVLRRISREHDDIELSHQDTNPKPDQALYVLLEKRNEWEEFAQEEMDSTLATFLAGADDGRAVLDQVDGLLIDQWEEFEEMALDQPDWLVERLSTDDTDDVDSEPDPTESAS